MWEIPYICFSILVLLVICVACYLRLRAIERAIRIRFEQRIRIACELHDTMLQTVQGSKLVADAALEKSDDSVHMRLTLEKLSSWLGQAMQEGQATLNALRTATTTSHKKAQKSQK